MNKIISVRSETILPANSPKNHFASLVPLRNEDLRTILSDLKAGKEVDEGLLERFLSPSPLKEHPFSLEKTTDQGVLLVVLTHLLRGSLVDEHSTFKNPPNHSNLYRRNAENALNQTNNLANFKAALKLKLEAFHTKNLKTIGGAVMAAGTVDLVSPFHWIGLVKDVMMGYRSRDELNKPRGTGSVYNDGFRAHFIGKKVEQALLDIRKTEEQLPWAKILINEDATHAQKAKAAMALFNLSQITLTFGNDPAVLKALAEHLPVFTDRNAKMAISYAICEGRFSVNEGVLKTLYRRNMVSLKDLMTSSPSMQTALYPEFKFNLTPPPGISSSDPSLPSFFGAKRYPSSEVKAALTDKFGGMSEEALESMCDDNATYAFQIYGNYAVLCNIGAGSVSEVSFKGWITSDFPIFYADTLGKVDVYDCSVLTDGYPSKMEASETHADFNALPMYLMEAIRQNSFDSSKFKHPQTIGFVVSTILGPIVQKNPELGNTMKGIIQQAILNKGGDVSIASTPAEDGAIKDAINALCAEVAETHNFEVSVMTYFNSLSNDQDKARLAYLLGQIAKAGVLGYHHGEENQANLLFYSLSKKCFDELKSSREMVFPPDFHTNLGKGVCIAVVTSSFRYFERSNEFVNGFVGDIFEKN